jgi:TP901 family phage tail tape measure protein
MADRSIFVRLGVVASGVKKGMQEASVAAKAAAADIEQAGKKADAAVEKSAAKLPLLARAGSAIGAQWTKAKGQVSALGAEVVASRDELDRLGTTAALAGGLLVAGAAAATGRFADFDEAMSSVSATGVDARANLGALREEAIALGAATKYSASEAAAGIENMLKAGVSARDVIGGGLTGALNLAAAGQMSVADAAEVSATALTQFGLSGSQMTHVADLLAAGAGKAQGEVSDLAQALAYVGPVAAGMGVSIEETTGALAAFASQGLIGEQAGTSLRGVLASLTSPSTAASKEIHRLGIDLYDASGKFKGLSNVAGQLSDAYGGMRDSARDASLGIIFGNAQVTAARVLFAQGADGVQGWTEQVNDAGYAAQAAATKMDNLKGDLEQLSGAIDSTLIEAGSGLNGMLRSLTQQATGTVNTIGSLPAPLLEAGLRMTALTGAGLLVAGAFTKGAVGLATWRSSLAKIGEESPKVASALEKTSRAAKGVGIAVAAIQIASVFGSMQQQQIDKTTGSLTDMAEALGSVAGSEDLAKLNSEVRRVQGSILGFSTGAPLVADVGSALKQLSDGGEGLAGFGNGVARTMNGLVGLKTNFDQLAEQVGKVDQALATMDPGKAQQAFAGISQAATDQGVSIEALAAQFPAYKAELQATAIQLGVNNLSNREYAEWMAGKVPAAITATMNAGTGLNANLTSTQQALAGAGQSAQDYADSMFKLANDALKASGSQIGFEAAIDDTAAAIKKNGKGLDTNTEKGRANQRALDDLATSSHAYVQTLVAQGATGDQAAAVMERARKAYIRSAEAAGASKTEAREMADAMGLIPADVKAEIDTSLNQEGINNWKRYKPPGKTAWITPKLTKDTLYVKVVRGESGHGGGGRSDLDRNNADGGLWARSALADTGASLHRQYADGGFDGTLGAAQPQIRPYSGPRGLTWSEEGSGPWEAFISGHPAKRSRSISIWAQAGQELGVLPGYANGGMYPPGLERLLAGGGQRVLYSSPTYYGPTINTVVNYPVAEPASASTNRALQAAAAVGR